MVDVIDITIDELNEILELQGMLLFIEDEEEASKLQQQIDDIVGGGVHGFRIEWGDNSFVQGKNQKRKRVHGVSSSVPGRKKHGHSKR